MLSLKEECLKKNFIYDIEPEKSYPYQKYD